MSENPTVGRIVHFYSSAVAGMHPAFPKNGYNGAGEGPYAAIVTQVFGGDMVNLKVLPPFAAEFDQGSVVPRGHSLYQAGGNFWEWPPRE